MAVHGSPLVAPFTLTTPDLIAPLASNLLVTPYEMLDISLISVPIQGRFPTSPVAWAFLFVVDFEWTRSGLSWPPYFVPYALSPESNFLELTIGQIWPR